MRARLSEALAAFRVVAVFNESDVAVFNESDSEIDGKLMAIPHLQVGREVQERLENASNLRFREGSDSHREAAPELT